METDALTFWVIWIFMAVIGVPSLIIVVVAISKAWQKVPEIMQARIGYVLIFGTLYALLVTIAAALTMAIIAVPHG